MTAQQTAAKERFEVICRAAGAEKERKRICRAIAPLVKRIYEVCRAFGGCEGRRCDMCKQADAIKKATRAPVRKGRR